MILMFSRLTHIGTIRHCHLTLTSVSYSTFLCRRVQSFPNLQLNRQLGNKSDKSEFHYEIRTLGALSHFRSGSKKKCQSSFAFQRTLWLHDNRDSNFLRSYVTSCLQVKRCCWHKIDCYHGYRTTPSPWNCLQQCSVSSSAVLGSGGDDNDTYLKFKDDPEMQSLMRELRDAFESEFKQIESNHDNSDTDTKVTSEVDEGSVNQACVKSNSADGSDDVEETNKSDNYGIRGIGVNPYMAETQAKTSVGPVEIEEFSDYEEYGSEDEDVEPEWIPPIDLKRGKDGVFDLKDLMTVLRDENAHDICVIRLPPEARFADFMVIVSAMSVRHMVAIAEDIKWIYKRKKSTYDRTLFIEGLDTKDWLALDMGNIVLHVFLPSTREEYDLETLWTVGEEYDEKCKQQDEEPYTFSADDLPWLQGFQSEEEKK